MKVKTRFAPSPTGYLHIGGARTALYSWLFAKHAKGQFVLRIEDSDFERSTPEAVEAIIEGMNWLKLSWNEGPFFQTQRFERYNQVIDRMLKEGKAYRCYCSKERLDRLRYQKMAQGEKPHYDGHCRYNEIQMLPNSISPHVVRFANPREGSVVFNDLIRGDIEVNNTELDDLIIRRTDGSPTYNFCVVIDDWDMEITHVIRGEDHINNTPRQINILRSLGAPVPKYAHVSMILADDGQKLSKRHGAVSVMQYRDEGYLPEAVLNYLVRLGWSHGDKEIFSLDEMIGSFTLDAVNKSPSAINTDKLLWLNHHYINNLDADHIAEYLLWHMQKQGYDLAVGPDLPAIVKLYGERCKTLKEIAESCRYCYEDFNDFEPAAAKKHLRLAARKPLTFVEQKLATIPEIKWDRETIHSAILAAIEELDIGMGKMGMPLRVAVTGTSQSPPLDAIVSAIGKARTLKRIALAVDYIDSRQSLMAQ